MAQRLGRSDVFYRVLAYQRKENGRRLVCDGHPSHPLVLAIRGGYEYFLICPVFLCGHQQRLPRKMLHVRVLKRKPDSTPGAQ